MLAEMMGSIKFMAQAVFNEFKEKFFPLFFFSFFSEGTSFLCLLHTVEKVLAILFRKA